MKISLLIAAIIVALASLVASRQQIKIHSLETEWETLKLAAIEKKISLDPDVSFGSKRRHSSGIDRSARDLAIKDFAAELVDFLQRMKASQQAGNSSEAKFEKEMITLLDKLTNMNATDYRILAKVISDDSSIEKQIKMELFSMPLMLLSSENPEIALALLDEQNAAFGTTEKMEDMLPMILSQLAAKDPDAAAARVKEKQFFGDLEELVSMTAGNDMSAAIALIDSLDLENPARAIFSLARNVKPGDQSAFFNTLISKNLTPSEKKDALGQLAFSPLMNDFEEATAWLASDQVSDEDHTSILNSMTYRGVGNSPEKWLGWMSENNADAEVTSKIISGWTRENFVASGEWIQSQEAGPVKDAAAKSYANTLAPYEPAAAAAWAETLPPGDDRTRLLTKIHESLKAKDPTAAASLAEKHQLPE